MLTLKFKIKNYLTIFALIFPLFLFACTKTPKHILVEDDGRWQLYLNHYLTDIQPYRLNLSLRIGSKERTQRTTAILWGNDHKTLRLDAFAGLNTLIASIQENNEEFQAWIPSKNILYTGKSSKDSLDRIGIAVPFTLAEISQILQGRFHAVFANEYEKIAPQNDALIGYCLKDGGLIALDIKGRPLYWQESVISNKGWNMAIIYDDAGLPRSLRMLNDVGRLVIVRVNSRDTVDNFPENKMQINLPKQFTRESLDDLEYNLRLR